jgi:hypothetical protein
VVTDTKSVTANSVSQIGKIKASRSLWKKAGCPKYFFWSFRRPEIPKIASSLQSAGEETEHTPSTDAHRNEFWLPDFSSHLLRGLEKSRRIA